MAVQHVPATTAALYLQWVATGLETAAGMVVFFNAVLPAQMRNMANTLRTQALAIDPTSTPALPGDP